MLLVGHVCNMLSQYKLFKKIIEMNYRAQVVGWPPVRSYRKSMLSVQKKSSLHNEEGNDSSPSFGTKGNGGGGAALVKVSMDGAPYLRKVDLRMYKSYQDLSDALGNMFSSFTIGNYFIIVLIYIIRVSK